MPVLPKEHAAPCSCRLCLSSKSSPLLGAPASAHLCLGPSPLQPTLARCWPRCTSPSSCIPTSSPWSSAAHRWGRGGGGQALSLLLFKNGDAMREEVQPGTCSRRRLERSLAPAGSPLCGLLPFPCPCSLSRSSTTLPVTSRVAQPGRRWAQQQGRGSNCNWQVCCCLDQRANHVTPLGPLPAMLQSVIGLAGRGAMSLGGASLRAIFSK